MRRGIAFAVSITVQSAAMMTCALPQLREITLCAEPCRLTLIAPTLTPDQDKNSGQQRQHAGDNSYAKTGESNNSDRDEINRQQQHADIFGNHGIIFPRFESQPLKFL
jgi:hypothetical protein